MLVNEQLGSGDPADILYQVTVDPGTAAALFTKGTVPVRDLLTNTVVVGPTLGPSLVFNATLSQGEGKLFHLQSDYSAERRPFRATATTIRSPRRRRSRRRCG